MPVQHNHIKISPHIENHADAYNSDRVEVQAFSMEARTIIMYKMGS